MSRLAAPTRGFSGVGTLINGLVASWTFQDALHLGYEPNHAYDMVVQGGPTSVPGPSTNIPLAAHFTSGSPNIIYIPSGDVRTHAFTPGSGSFSFGVWSNLEDATQDHMIFAHGRTLASYNANIEYYFIAQLSGHQYKLQLFGNAAETITPAVVRAGSASGTGKWTACLGWADMEATPPRAFLQLDNGVVASGSVLASSGNIVSVSEPVSIGAWLNSQGVANSRMAGALAAPCYWNRTLNAAERAAWYNGGLGSVAPFLLRRFVPVARTAAPSRSASL